MTDSTDDVDWYDPSLEEEEEERAMIETRCVVCGRPYKSPDNEHFRSWCSVGCQFSESFNASECWDKAFQRGLAEGEKKGRDEERKRCIALIRKHEPDAKCRATTNCAGVVGTMEWVIRAIESPEVPDGNK